VPGAGQNFDLPPAGVRENSMDELGPEIDSPEPRRCAICGETAPYGFGPPGGPAQPADAWYCGTHRLEGERRWAPRYGTRPADS
jgi:hypothetical protein